MRGLAGRTVYAVLGSVLAGMALVAVSTPGFAKTLPASAGCDALNAGFFNYNDVPTLPGGPDTRTEVLVFTAGEKIGFSWQGIGGLTVQPTAPM